MGQHIRKLIRFLFSRKNLIFKFEARHSSVNWSTLVASSLLLGLLVFEGLSSGHYQVCCGLGSPGIEAGVGRVVSQVGIDLDSLSHDSPERRVGSLLLRFKFIFLLQLHLLLLLLL